jgi:hypothetical protein
MIDWNLMRSQKNEILELLKTTTLDPFNFSWTSVDSRLSVESEMSLTVSKLNYNNSSYYFVFDIHKNQHYSFYSPGEDKLHDRKYPGGWDQQLYYVQNWLTYLEREVSQPDMWEELERHRISYDNKIASDTSNEPFTVAQVDQLVEGIENIRRYLLNEFKGSSKAEDLINKKLDYLVGASRRQGRNDWFHTCLGVFVGIATALSMSPEQSKHIWTLLKSAVSGILRLLPY